MNWSRAHSDYVFLINMSGIEKSILEGLVLFIEHQYAKKSVYYYEKGVILQISKTQ